MESSAMSGQSVHIVWDWNGTLLHDTPLVVEATNAAFVELGFPPLTLARYRELYCVPVPAFYARYLGRVLSDLEWERMSAAFHRQYALRMQHAALAEGAAELLAAHGVAGRTQSLCSLAPHDQLVTLVDGHGIAEHFLRVDGAQASSGSDKAPQLEEHLLALAGVDVHHTVVIGDALDDARAARHVGAHAVLYSGGSHSRASLEGAGVPVVDTLAEAVETAHLIAGGAR